MSTPEDKQKALNDQLKKMFGDMVPDFSAVPLTNDKENVDPATLGEVPPTCCRMHILGWLHNRMADRKSLTEDQIVIVMAGLRMVLAQDLLDEVRESETETIVNDATYDEVRLIRRGWYQSEKPDEALKQHPLAKILAKISPKVAEGIAKLVARPRGLWLTTGRVKVSTDSTGLVVEQDGVKLHLDPADALVIAGTIGGWTSSNPMFAAEVAMASAKAEAQAAQRPPKDDE